MNNYFLFILLLCTVANGQDNNQEEYYKNGNLKYSHVITDSGELIKEYYKNGQLKYHKNDPQKTIEKYYKSGQLSYVQSIENNAKHEEFYDRDGHLTIVLINDRISFSVYETGLIKKDHNHHEHGHEHGHGHGHHH